MCKNESKRIVFLTKDSEQKIDLKVIIGVNHEEQVKERIQEIFQKYLDGRITSGTMMNLAQQTIEKNMFLRVTTNELVDEDQVDK